MAAATLDRVGAELGLTKASIYYYYENKDALLIAVLCNALEEISQEAEVQTNGLRAPLKKLGKRAWAHVLKTAHSPSGRLLASHPNALIEDKAGAAILHKYEEPTRKLLDEAKEGGLVQGIDTIAATKMLFSSMNSISKWYKTENRTLEEAFEGTWKIFIGGIEKN